MHVSFNVYQFLMCCTRTYCSICVCTSLKSYSAFKGVISFIKIYLNLLLSFSVSYFCKCCTLTRCLNCVCTAIQSYPVLGCVITCIKVVLISASIFQCTLPRSYSHLEKTISSISKIFPRTQFKLGCWVNPIHIFSSTPVVWLILSLYTQ